MAFSIPGLVESFLLIQCAIQIHRLALQNSECYGQAQNTMCRWDIHISSAAPWRRMPWKFSAFQLKVLALDPFNIQRPHILFIFYHDRKITQLPLIHIYLKFILMWFLCIKTTHSHPNLSLIHSGSAGAKPLPRRRIALWVPTTYCCHGGFLFSLFSLSPL